MLQTGTTMRLQHKTPFLQQRPGGGGAAAIRSGSRMYPTGYETFFLPSKSRDRLSSHTPSCCRMGAYSATHNVYFRDIARGRATTQGHEGWAEPVGFSAAAPVACDDNEPEAGRAPIHHAQVIGGGNPCLARAGTTNNGLRPHTHTHTYIPIPLFHPEGKPRELTSRLTRGLLTQPTIVLDSVCSSEVKSVRFSH